MPNCRIPGEAAHSDPVPSSYHAVAAGAVVAGHSGRYFAAAIAALRALAGGGQRPFDLTAKRSSWKEPEVTGGKRLGIAVVVGSSRFNQHDESLFG
jgi:hypothetical protein